ncbi:MAG: LLM class flavin-dependent oxidoreductase, partial [Gammaproteobacteria bacterium]|nr:LLM class flavin-dependent oxidoreductase [Gammaproteobacteria bacterium]
MEYFPNLPVRDFDQPGAWAKAKEAQGWHGICASDHLFLGDHRYPHVFVTAMAMVGATERIRVTTSFANNLFRSPVEFAQAALALQTFSGGRFEAGLGAGWAAAEMRAMGMTYPDGPMRVSLYVEALQIAAALIRTGQCRFSGEHYRIDIAGDSAIGPTPARPPLLIASAGGPRALREVTPLVDRVEIKASARGTRGGALDLATVATVTEDEVKRNVERVKAIDAAKPLGIFLLVAAGEDPEVMALKDLFGNGYLGQFVGHPDEVARSL